MIRVRVWLGMAGLAVGLAGCASDRLQQRALTPQEAGWADYFQYWYPGWQPPPLSPLQKAGGVTPAGEPPDIVKVPAAETDFSTDRPAVAPASPREPAPVPSPQAPTPASGK